MGSCLTLGNELSEETYVLTKQKIFGGRDTREDSRREKGSGGVLCHKAHSLGVYGDGVSFRLVFGQAFWPRVLPGSAKMDASEQDSGRRSDTWCFILTFPELLQLVVACQFPVPYQDLWSENNSRRWLLWCLARVTISVLP